MGMVSTEEKEVLVVAEKEERKEDKENSVMRVFCIKILKATIG